MAWRINLFVSWIYQLWYSCFQKRKRFLSPLVSIKATLILPEHRSDQSNSTYTTVLTLKKNICNWKTSSEHLRKHQVWSKFTSDSLRTFLLVNPPGCFFTYTDFLPLTLRGVSMRRLKLTLFMVFHLQPFKQNLFPHKNPPNTSKPKAQFCTYEPYKDWEIIFFLIFSILFFNLSPSHQRIQHSKAQFSFNYKHNRVKLDEENSLWICKNVIWNKCRQVLLLIPVHLYWINLLLRNCTLLPSQVYLTKFHSSTKF